MSGLAIEAATEHVEVAVIGDAGVLAHVREDVGHGHTQRLAALTQAALGHARTDARGLTWVAASLGPGSFTGVRVGLATARAYALAAGAPVYGASTLASLAHAAPARRALIVPLVGAGRRDVYAGFFRAGARGPTSLLAAPRVLPADALLDAVAEVHALVPELAVRFVGPGAGRERERLERGYPTSTALAFRHDGLSALDLAAAARLGRGPGAGLPAPGREAEPVYVRTAQAEERVRHAANASVPFVLRDLTHADLPALVAIERRVFSDPWPESFFASGFTQADGWMRGVERDGELAAYLVARLDPPHGEIENLAVVPAQRRSGLARLLLEDLYGRCRVLGVSTLMLEARVSNDAAQALYRTAGFRYAGLRRGYYRDPVEDALLMTGKVPE